MQIILLGPPGAGKGTQSAYLERQYGLAKLSTGDMLRGAAKSGSELGNHVRQVMAEGKLVDDTIMINLIRERIAEPDCANGFILDGFPRTTAQAQALDIMLRDVGCALNHVIELAVVDDEMIARICGRFSCKQCGEGYHDNFKPTAKEDVCDICSGTEFIRREDDNRETVAKRLESYHHQTAPLLPYYAKQGTLRQVDGMADIHEVTNQIAEILDGVVVQKKLHPGY